VLARQSRVKRVRSSGRVRAELTETNATRVTGLRHGPSSVAGTVARSHHRVGSTPGPARHR
jgi:hypothetical protein